MQKVSIVIPTHNRAHLIRRAIGSVLNQIYQDFEIIIVDDASTDNTREVVESFNDKRIRYIRHENKRGAAAARNTGITSASGKYIAFQDSDDKWLPEKLGRQVEILETSPSEVGVVHTKFSRIIDNEKVYLTWTTIHTRETDIHKKLLKGNFIGTPTTLLKKECFERVGMFDERLTQLEDWEMWIRISKYHHFKYLDDPLVITYSMPDSVSIDHGNLIRAHELILEKHFGEFQDDKSILAAEKYWIGNLLCQIGEMNRGRDFFFRAVRLDPLRGKFSGAILASLLGPSAYNKLIRLKRQVQPGWKSLDI